MAGPWDTPPTAEELRPGAGGVWDAPPTPDELGAAPRGGPSVASTAVHSGLQGATLGFADEITGAMGAGLQAITNHLPQSIRDDLDLVQAPSGDAYADIRDQERQTVAEGREANPVTALLTEAAGGLLVPGGAVKGLGGALKAGTKMGAAYGIGSSESDSVGGTLLDGAIGAGFGGAGGAAGYGVGKLARKLLGKPAGVPAVRGAVNADVEAGSGVAGMAGRKTAAAEARIAELAAEKHANELRAAGGALGGEVQKGSRMTEFLSRPDVAASLGPDDAALLRELESSGAMDALRRRVARSQMEALPGQTGAIGKADQLMREAQDNAPARLEELAKEIGNPLNQLMPRLQRYLPPVVGDIIGSQTGAGMVGRAAVGAGLGYTYGDSRGAAYGALAGAGLRPAIQSAIRGLKHPSVQRTIWAPIAAIAKTAPEAIGRFGPMLARAMANGADEGFALHLALMQSAPEYVAALAALVTPEAEAAQPPP